MDKEEVNEVSIFYTVRNRILAEIREKFRTAWADDSEYCLKLSLLAAEGACARETKKVAAVLNNTLKEMQTVSKKLEEQIERLEAGRAIGHIEGIDWDLVKDYFEMKGGDV